VDEIATLAARHDLDRFMSVDNILDNRYFARALPALKELGGLSLFYETKANLSRQQVRELSDAGVCWIQPGIEALHDDLLGLLKKGTTVCINVQLLKWARTYGIWVIWNHLFGAPGDRREWYDEIADWLPLITHLQAPAGAGLTRIRYDRFSPYFQRATEYGLQLEPYWAYSQVYPLDAGALSRQAYFFVDRGADGWFPERLQALMDAWGKSWLQQRPGSLPEQSPHAPELSMADEGGTIRIRDTRPCAVAATHVLIGLDAEIYRACDAARSPSSVVDGLRRAAWAVTEDEVGAAVARLIDAKILARFGDRLLSLATGEPARPYRGFENYPGGLACCPKRQRPRDLIDFDPGDVPLRQLFAPSVTESTGVTR
jgi:magnesium-protoporphyrin IX monomethyl ester (oxidative) cyclase